jgi:hypothetical protein
VARMRPMKAQIRVFTAGLALGAALAAVVLVGSPLAAVDDSRKAGGKSQSGPKVVLDNSRVRVRDVTFPSGSAGMHTHELAHVGIVIQGGTLVFKYPNGASASSRSSSSNAHPSGIARSAVVDSPNACPACCAPGPQRAVSLRLRSQVQALLPRKG